MNFPALQSLHCCAGSLRRLWRQLPPGGSLPGDFSPAFRQNLISVGEGFPLPLVGRKLQAKQSLRRSRASSLCTREPWVCANIVRNTLHAAGGAGSLYRGCLFSFVRTLQADLRGVMRLWRCAPAPYRVCADIGGDIHRSGDHWSPVLTAQIQPRRGAFHMPPLVWNFILTTGGSPRPEGALPGVALPGFCWDEISLMREDIESSSTKSEIRHAIKIPAPTSEIHLALRILSCD